MISREGCAEGGRTQNGIPVMCLIDVREPRGGVLQGHR